MPTVIAYSKNLNQGKYDALNKQAHFLGAIRSDVWQLFGSINSIQLTDRHIRNEWIKTKSFNVLANAWKETLRDAIDNIKANREAAKYFVKQTLQRCCPKEHLKQKYQLLKSDKWLSDNYLARLMRKYWKRGHNHIHHQIIIRSDDYTTFTLNENGRVWLKIPSLIKGKRIAIPLNTTIKPTGTLRCILKENKVEIHYFVEPIIKQDCGIQTVGIDKGFSEVLTDSDGIHYGTDLGKVLTDESDYQKKKYQRRNKLRKIAKKKPWINKHNLGRKKLNRRRKKHQAEVKTVIHTAVNKLIDKANIIVAEDLTKTIAGKKFNKNVNRRLSSWTKGVIAKALTEISHRRGSSVILVNAAYTSQMDSRNGTLTGRRCGDSFYCADGVVLQADWNAARNVLARLYDVEIHRWTPFQQVKAILLKRTSAHSVETAQPRL